MNQHLPDAEATARLGQGLAACLPAESGLLVFLEGSLGAGKTSLARAFLRALGVQGPVRSPTYTLIEHYSTRAGACAHLDLYRIADAGELEFLGLPELLAEARVLLVEWADRGAAALPAADLEIRLEHAASGRRVELSSRSPRGAAWLLASERRGGGLGSGS